MTRWRNRHWRQMHKRLRVAKRRRAAIARQIDARALRLRDRHDWASKPLDYGQRVSLQMARRARLARVRIKGCGR